MHKDATYWRARLDAIEQIIIEERGGDRSEKNNNSVLLRNGIVPEELTERYNKAFKEHHNAWLKSGNEQQLSFSEITRFNTWFQIHPEKVAGKEIITTSREFPISIKGTETNILMTITKTLQSKRNITHENNRSVRFSFTASNITVYDTATNNILAQSMHDSKNLLRLLKKFPDFIDREAMRKRLEDYYKDIPQKTKDVVFQDSRKRLRIIKAKAEAKMKLLNLLKT